MAWASVGHDVVLVVAVVVDDALQTCPRVLNVIKVTPQVAVLNDRAEVRLKTEHHKSYGNIITGKGLTCVIILLPLYGDVRLG